MPKPVELGKNVRMNFAKVEEVRDMPDLIGVQKESYQWFLRDGIRETLRDVSAITDYYGNLVLGFVDYSLDIENQKYTLEECRENETTYAAPLKVRVSLMNKETGELKEQDIFMGTFPLMTEAGTFVINGAERVVVSQLVRAPSVYFSHTFDRSGSKVFSAQLIPNRGAWLEYEIDANGIFYVRVDRARKIPVTVLLRAVGLSSDDEILDRLGENEMIIKALEKDFTTSTDEALLEIYKKLRSGEPSTAESAKSLMQSLFCDSKRYDLARVGRYKINKKLALYGRILGQQAHEDVIDENGVLLARKGDLLTRKICEEIDKSSVSEVWLNVDGSPVKVISNKMVYLSEYIDFDIKEAGLSERVRKDVLDEILANHTEDADNQSLIKDLRSRVEELAPRVIQLDDIVASVNYFCNLYAGIGSTDDIDHLGNRRLRSVGELLQNQFKIGFARMERVVRERMTIQDADSVTPQSLVNMRSVYSAVKEFFGSSQLSQFMDQTNPLAELTHKRRLSALGPGGLSRERAGFEVRDVHHSHYGRMCPIETPEGPNIGLITSLSTYALVNEYGFILSPYRRVDQDAGVVTDQVEYMTTDIEDNYYIAQANEPLDSNNWFVNKKILVRHREEFLEVEREIVDYMDVSPKQVVSVATAMIPFLENDDANRALMGANMQRQAVPLLVPESPIVGTGIEYKVARDSGAVIVAKESGTVKTVTASKIVVKNSSGSSETYKLSKFMRSNQGTCMNQRPIVNEGDVVQAGDIIADGPSTENGEIALGRNVLIGFMTWEGYNYEDAILISEKLVRDDVFTSIHIEEYEAEARDTKLGSEEITRDVPNVGEDAMRDLDERGIIRIGAEVQSGSVLVGKVTPKGETELTSEERLLRAIFGEKAREVRDTSLRVPHGESGIVVDVKIFTREQGYELPSGVNCLVRCYVAQRRKISVGDKMAGRHGNKGVISRILPEEDMPFLPDGTPLEIVLNPLGVPSRMNIGQVLEVHLGYAAKALGWKVMTPVFDGATEEEIMQTLEQAGYDADGKTVLYDGRTGKPFDNRVTVGYMYYLKLAHLVDDKIHARSTGPYSLVTQQPLGGKAQFGGQRFGEMEVWALEAYGAAYTLQEVLTVKSDDIVGRVKTYEAIVKGENVPKPGIPEAFKVLIKELQSLCLDVKLFDKGGSEILIREEQSEDEPNSLTFGNMLEDLKKRKNRVNEVVVEKPNQNEDDNGYEDEDSDDVEMDFDEENYEPEADEMDDDKGSGNADDKNYDE